MLKKTQLDKEIKRKRTEKVAPNTPKVIPLHEGNLNNEINTIDWQTVNYFEEDMASMSFYGSTYKIYINDLLEDPHFPLKEFFDKLSTQTKSPAIEDLSQKNYHLIHILRICSLQEKSFGESPSVNVNHAIFTLTRKAVHTSALLFLVVKLYGFLRINMQSLSPKEQRYINNNYSYYIQLLKGPFNATNLFEKTIEIDSFFTNVKSLKRSISFFQKKGFTMLNLFTDHFLKISMQGLANNSTNLDHIISYEGFRNGFFLYPTITLTEKDSVPTFYSYQTVSSLIMLWFTDNVDNKFLSQRVTCDRTRIQYEQISSFMNTISTLTKIIYVLLLVKHRYKFMNNLSTLLDMSNKGKKSNIIKIQLDTLIKSESLTNNQFSQLISVLNNLTFHLLSYVIKNCAMLEISLLLKNVIPDEELLSLKEKYQLNADQILNTYGHTLRTITDKLKESDNLTTINQDPIEIAK